LEAFLKKILHKSGNIKSSTLQTVAATFGLIQELCVRIPELREMANAPVRVLSVDDDPIARRFMTNALQLKFLLPQSAVDGRTAVDLAAGHPFDVIFLDVQMPDLDGFEVCKQIRNSAANRLTPVVFVTSHEDSSMKARARECGGNDFISKPYMCSELALKTIAFAYRNRITNRGRKNGRNFQ
jgi:PleD family two-component response regulator